MVPVTLFDVTDDWNLNLPRCLRQVHPHPRWLPRRRARNQLFVLTLFEDRTSAEKQRSLQSPVSLGDFFHLESPDGSSCASLLFDLARDVSR